jgi:hypothetical protein
MAQDADIEHVAIDLTLGIQADILIDLASGFARINHVAAAETILTMNKPGTERLNRSLDTPYGALCRLSKRSFVVHCSPTAGIKLS